MWFLHKKIQTPKKRQEKYSKEYLNFPLFVPEMQPVVNLSIQCLRMFANFLGALILALRMLVFPPHDHLST